DVNFESHQFGGEFWEPFWFPVGVAHLNGDVLPFHVTQFAESLTECVNERSVRCGSERCEKANPVHLLRLDGERQADDRKSACQERAAVQHGGTLLRQARVVKRLNTGVSGVHDLSASESK